MSSWNAVSRLLRAIVLGAALLAPLAAPAAVPASWKDTGFAIDANGMTLRQVFEEFGRIYGVRLSYELPHDALTKGRLRAANGIEFLDRLAQPYKFRWFVYNETLYIVPRDDNASMRLQVGEDAVLDAKQALIGIGLFDPRFGWGELPDEGTVIISGPRAYVELARSILLPEERQVALAGRQVMLFRLKYASATDRVITSRGRTETIPGVKTILSNLLFGPDSAEKISDARARLDVGRHKRSRRPAAGAVGVREVGDSLPRRGTRPARNDEDGDAYFHASWDGAGRDARPRIEADPSLNAIIIYDNGSKREMYQSLIEQLDVEPRQVEIEALIVDIDRSKLAELGVEWGANSRSGKISATVNASFEDSKDTELPLAASTLLINNAALFHARLKALQARGEAHVVATPTVLTLDNVAAVLDLSQTRYMPLLAERYADLADITAGTMLRVIPRIVQEDPPRVRLEVDIEDGVLGNGGTAEAAVTRSTISTQAIVDVQQTLVIGGYHVESLTNNFQKIPLLGDVPVFGGLFRSETQSYGARERLFLITPRLVGSQGTFAQAQSRMNARRDGSIARAEQAFAAVRAIDEPTAPARTSEPPAAPQPRAEVVPVVAADTSAQAQAMVPAAQGALAADLVPELASEFPVAAQPPSASSEPRPMTPSLDRVVARLNRQAEAAPAADPGERYAGLLVAAGPRPQAAQPAPQVAWLPERVPGIADLLLAN